MFSGGYSEMTTCLGSWIINDESILKSEWDWFVNDSVKFLFFQVSQKWRRHFKTSFKYTSYY